MIYNPIIRGFNPDPSITFDGENYIIATSTFEYYPGVSLYVSKDLKRWDYHSSVLRSENGFSLSGVRNSSGIYAPTIRYYGGRYYMVTTNKNGFGNLITSTDSLSHPWGEAKFIHKTGIDPSLLFLPDGSCFYTQNGKGGLFGAFIDPETGKLETELKLISPGVSGNATEASHIYIKDGWFYLIFAEGGTEMGHHEMVGRSKNIFGPYEIREEPILSHVDRKGHEIQATGHADLLELDDGRWIAVFLATRMPSRAHIHNLGRESFMKEVSWEDGWPVIGNVELEEESLIETEIPEPYYYAFGHGFDNAPILRVRAEHKECYEEGEDIMKIHGGCKLSEPLGEPSLLLLRQEAFETSFTATLKTDESLTGRAGVTVFYNSDYHAALYAERCANGIKLTFRRHIHDLEAVVFEEVLCERDRIIFEIRSDREWYSFYADGRFIAKASIAAFSTESTMYMTFTGTLLGIFAENGDGVFEKGFGIC